MNEFKEVPFTSFATRNHQIGLELHASSQRSRLVIDNSMYLELPEKVIPLKVLELQSNRFLIIGRVMFSGQLRMFSVDSTGKNLLETELPSELAYHIFKQAFVNGGKVFVILYDVINLENKLYRWEISIDNKAPVVDMADYYHLQFNGRYEVDANILVAEYKNKMYFVGEGVCYVYDETAGFGVLDRFQMPGQLTVVELKSTPFGIAGLFQDEAVASLPGDELVTKQIYKIYDLESLTEISLDRTYRIPFELRYEGGWIASDISSPADLPRMLSFDLRNRMPSGIYDLGGNNFEGRVAWSQVYYLNGMIDLVKEWDRSEVSFRFLGSLQEDLKLRLDLEVYFLDRLLDDGNPGLLCKRYSIDRAPVVHAVQTGRILRLLKRYVNEVSGDLPLKNFEALVKSTETLAGHIEVLAVANGEPEAVPGQYFLKWPKGSAFWADGVGLPYNHQNDWAGGVTYGKTSSTDSRSSLGPARDVIVTLLRNELFYTLPPSDFVWRYDYGRAWFGWQVGDGISKNTPSFAGSRNPAHISYRTIDAMAVLSVARIFPEILPESFPTYVKAAVEKNRLYLFTSEELLNYDILPEISFELAAINARVKSPWELQNSGWALLSLYQKIAVDSRVGKRLKRSSCRS